MANGKGEVSLDLGGTSYTLVLGTNQLIELEELFAPLSLDLIFLRAANGSLKHIRGLMWAALRKHHPDLTVERVGELVDAAGGVFGLSEQLKALGLSTQPDQEDVRALGVDTRKRPRTAQARRKGGTGAGSTSTRGASA